MPTKLVLGLQHGDEGKGRIVDDLVQDWADVIVRFQGGGNAGHTVYDKEGNKFVTHTLPVGVLDPQKLNIISRGCVLNIKELLDEIIELVVSPHTLKISGWCPLIEPTHILKDKLKYQQKIGTTAKGIGPAYSDFYARDSVLFKDFIENPEAAKETFKQKFDSFQKECLKSEISTERLLNHVQFFNLWMEKFDLCALILKDFILDDEGILNKLYTENKNILLEGAQGCGLNIFSNNYPDVTSSAPTTGGALNSTGLSHKQIDEVIGVIKSYKTKVGSGEFRTRCNEKDESVLAHHGKEFGATTGRPRKCGWLDIDEINHAIMMNGVDHLCVVKTDVLTNIEEPYVYYNKEFHRINKIDDVDLKDESFKNLLDIIKDQTGVKQITYTTGPKRGEIVWA